MKQHYVYLTTNLVNNMKYIGMHYGELDDAYLGSGKLLNLAIKKYGRDNFKKEIIKIANSAQENAQNEKEIIKEYNAIADRNFYNIHEGGFGGDTWSGQPEYIKEQRRQEISQRYSGAGNPRYGAFLTEETKQKIRKNRDTKYMLTSEYRQVMSKAMSGEKNGMYGKHHTSNTKMKISMSKRGKLLKSDNGNAKQITAYLDAEHTQKVKSFSCIQDALIYVGTKSTDYSGISKRIKQNKPYKGYYWVKGVETNQ